MFYVAHPSAAGKLCSSFMPLLTSFTFLYPVLEERQELYLEKHCWIG